MFRKFLHYLAHVTRWDRTIGVRAVPISRWRMWGYVVVSIWHHCCPMKRGCGEVERFGVS